MLIRLLRRRLLHKIYFRVERKRGRLKIIKLWCREECNWFLFRIDIWHLPSKLIIYKWISKWTTSGQRRRYKGWWWLHMIRGQENKSCLQQKLAEIVIFNGCWEETMHRVRTLHTKQDTGFWLVDSVNQGLWLVSARVHQSCFIEWGVIGNTLVENKEKIKMTLLTFPWNSKPTNTPGGGQ